MPITRGSSRGPWPSSRNSLTSSPGSTALMVELEGCGQETPRRIPLYEAWAKEHSRKPFAELAHPLNPRAFDAPEWRDYTTHRRIEILRAVERAVRGKGFRGELTTIFDNSGCEYGVTMEVNLRMAKERLPDWSCVTYEHDKWNHRYASMDSQRRDTQGVRAQGASSAARCDDLVRRVAHAHFHTGELAPRRGGH